MGQATLKLVVHVGSDLDRPNGVRLNGLEHPRLIDGMEGIGGIDFQHWLDRLRRCDASAEALPVIVVTAAGRTPRLYARALQLGVRDYLTKPATPAQLAARVLEFTDGDASSAAVDLSSKEGAKERAASTDPETGNLADLPLPELLHALHARGDLESGQDPRAVGALLGESFLSERPVDLLFEQ